MTNYRGIAIDEETRELRWRSADLWDGTHEVYEWRVLDRAGVPIVVEANSDITARRSFRTERNILFVYAPNGGGYLDQYPLESTPARFLQTPCRRALNARNRKCPGCDLQRDAGLSARAIHA